MPYAKKEDKAAQMREYRKRQRDENKAVLERIRAFPEFQQYSKAEQKSVEKTFLQNLVAFDKIVDEKLKELEIYAKMKIDEFYDQKLKAVLELSLQFNKKAEQLKEMLNKNE